MAGNPLSAINSDFVRKLQGFGPSTSTGKSVTNAISGRGSSSAQLTLQRGAQAYVNSLGRLNDVGNAINLSKQNLEKLGALTDDLIDLAQKAGKGSAGSITRDGLNLKFQKIGKEFREIIEGSKIKDQEYLTKEGLSEIFKSVGLDPKQSEDIAKAFDELILAKKDDALVSEKIKGGPLALPTVTVTIIPENPNGDPKTGNGDDDEDTIPLEPYDIEVPIPKPNTTIDILDSNLRSRSNALYTLNNLKALKEQITDNVKALGEITEVLGTNIESVRITGLSMLAAAEEVKSNAQPEEVARSLRAQIRRQVNSPSVLAGLNNLDPILSATLLAAEENE